jgi:ParB/RepB/Spo0J family partition protein
MLAVDQIKPNPHNARVHSRAQLDEIAKSIEAVGWTVPILTDERRRVIAGHGRLEAAKLNGLERVPVIILHGLSEAKKRALALADNKRRLGSATPGSRAAAACRNADRRGIGHFSHRL